MLQQKKVGQPDSGKFRRTHHQEINLLNCDREPIHIPGSIQAHGYLIAFAESGEILHLSQNVGSWQGQPAEQFLGKGLSSLLGQEAISSINSILKSNKRKGYLSLTINLKGEQPGCDGLLHRYDEINILEIEPLKEARPAVIDFDLFNSSMQSMQESQSTEAMAQVLAEEFRELTHFDRIMVYRFKDDFSGEVIAEAKAPHTSSFLGLHFPSTDIPAQARALYQKKYIRLIPDVEYVPVPVLPEINNISGKPLDLSMASLRSVSPIHIQYLKNMGVKASMSVSIIRNGHLWGMVACHHHQPNFVSYQKRQLCELLSRTFATMLSEKESLVQRKYYDQIQETKANLFRNVSKAGKLTDGLYKQRPGVQDLIRCGGCVISFGDDYVSLGLTPAPEQVQELIKWLQKEVHEEVFFSHKLSSLYEQARQFSDTGSGILAVAISQVQREYIIWFRPELVRSVTWAGGKDKDLQQADENEILTPRKSFDAWTEQLMEQAEPWLPLEIEVARELRGVLVGLVLQITGELKLRADILSRINEELDTSKNELDSFAYIVSHDLKEPLRGINNYASFLLEDYQARLDADGQAKLHTLMRLSDRMQQLIESLLHFSRMGRMELKLQAVDMGKVLAGVMDIFGQQISTEKVQVEKPEVWPTLSCDELRVSEIWMNLLSNALKYNNKSRKEVSLGYRKAKASETSPSGYVFYVADNGIGIDERQHDDIFNIFRRLHDRSAYGGGTGAGLTIVKKIVERHGGEIWLKSYPAKGTTFFFSL
jgi:chemotaxis family two-component system sensor kinase Cph1